MGWPRHIKSRAAFPLPLAPALAAPSGSADADSDSVDAGKCHLLQSAAAINIYDLTDDRRRSGEQEEGAG